VSEQPNDANAGSEIDPQEIGHVVLRVRDLERSTAFYELLGFRKVGEIGGMMAFFTTTGANHHDLALQAVGPNAPSPPPGSVGLYHVAIRLPSDEHVKRAFRMLASAGAEGSPTASTSRTPTASSSSSTPTSRAGRSTPRTSRRSAPGILARAWPSSR